MIGKILGPLVVSAAIAFGVGAAQAAETVVWWDFLGGGDGVRMKKLIEDFNGEHAGNIQIQATTLDWGIPFYSKVQTSTAIGQGPDIMTYHASRLPLGVSQNVLSEITDADMKVIGMTADSFAKATWDAVHIDSKQYAVPFDTHPIVLYYNKDKLAAAGLIGPNGLPTGLNGADNFMAALKKLKDGGSKWGIATVTADGSFAFRTIYSFLCQQDGKIGADGAWFPGDSQAKLAKSVGIIASWVTAGLNPKNTDYPSTVALFTSGDAPLMINGVWEVPTMVDLAKQNKLFNWGAIELPVLFDHACTYEDSHTLAIPNNQGKPQTPEKHAAVLEVIKWLEAHALYWATAGHIPANKAVTDSADYKALQPQATYAPLTANAVFDPKSKFAGVASPLFEAAGNSLTPAINGETKAEDAAAEMVTNMNAMK
jgi:multiple sugar transport system substrate-binding protein